jgi:hypothetical protein
MAILERFPQRYYAEESVSQSLAHLMAQLIFPNRYSFPDHTSGPIAVRRNVRSETIWLVAELLVS